MMTKKETLHGEFNTLLNIVWSLAFIECFIAFACRKIHLRLKCIAETADESQMALSECQTWNNVI